MTSTQLKQARDLADATGTQPPTPLAPSARSTETQPPARNEIRLSTLRDDEQGVKDLYEQFRTARASVGESEVKYESFRKLITQQRTRLLDEKDAVAVDFRIAVQDGKVALKAKPVRID